MLRTIAISLILVLSVGVMLPFANSAHGVRQTVQLGATKKHSYRYRSRAWWRRYRARLRQKRLAAELAHRKALLALPQNVAVGDLSGIAGPALPSLPTTSAVTATLPPPAMTARVPSASNGETRPRLVNAAHPANPAFTTATAPAPAPAPASVPAREPARLPGQMNLSVVALSRPNPAFLTSREQKRMLAGVAVADLRRMVIDKMVVVGGWVVNDFVREINGQRVFVVTARTPKDALTPEKAWTFYFTEAGGRIYGLTTDSTVEYAERMTVEAERFIESLRAKSEENR
ncbi:MAG TPA: hypothetical protein VFP64_13125 [Pyrinomonadaceae bacterium]|nr:hypothetical protein [Pyrinomonadaceae bacterium]